MGGPTNTTRVTDLPRRHTPISRWVLIYFSLPKARTELSLRNQLLQTNSIDVYDLGVQSSANFEYADSSGLSIVYQSALPYRYGWTTKTAWYSWNLNLLKHLSCIIGCNLINGIHIVMEFCVAAPCTFILYIPFIEREECCWFVSRLLISTLLNISENWLR